QVAGVVGLAELLDDDGALEARLPDEDTLVDLAHAAGPELLEHLVLGRLHGKGEGRAELGRRLLRRQGRRRGATLYSITEGASTPSGRGGRHMGLDVGDRRIGVALSDETATLASALTTVTRTGGRKDAAAVADLVRHHEVAAVVVGLPLNMNGTPGPQAEKVLGFVEGLRKRLAPVPV